MTVQYQATLREPLSFDGVGLHTGAAARVEISPAPADAGLVFMLAGGVQVPAHAENVVETARATVLGKDGVTISTVEHLLAALFAMGVDNATIAVNGPEIPAVDGSAQAFSELIAAAGLASQKAVRNRMVISTPQFFRDGDRALVVLPASRFRIKCISDFPAPVGTQYFDAEITPECFASEVAGARTWGYMHEVEALRKRGLAKGGSLENAVVFDAEGPIRPLRWPNEVVRHKVLDLIGDLALLGAYPQCEFIAIKSGHRLHCIATAELRKQNSGTHASARVQ